MATTATDWLQGMPSRYVTDLSGQLDATGAGSIGLFQPVLTWTKVSVNIQLSASPACKWTVAVGPQTVTPGAVIGRQIDGGLGNSVRSGPFVLAPGETITVYFTGGTPNDTATGSVFGLQDLDPQNLQADSVSNSSVSISAGQVNIAGTPSVVVTSGVVNIGNTPSVVISGTPTVILGGGTATVGSVNAINSTVTVAGTINIGNTPAVTVTSGTISIGNTPAVTVNSGTVSIGNTPSVTISGTPTVILGGGTANVGNINAVNSTVTVAGTINIGNTPAVSISGTPSVTIASGSVSISSGSVVISSGSITINNTPLPIRQGRTSGGSFTVAAGVTTTYNVAIDAGTEAIEVKAQLDSLNTGGFSIKVVGHTTNFVYYAETTYPTNTPVKVLAQVDNSLETSIDVTIHNVNVSDPTTYGRITLVEAIEEVTILSNPGQEPSIASVLNPVPIKKNPWSFGTNAPATGNRAGITFAAPGSGKQWIVDHFSADMVQNGAVGVADDLVIRNDVSGAGTVIWQRRVGCGAAAGDTAQWQESDMALPCGNNKALTLEFLNGKANINEGVNLAAYLIPWP